MSDDPSDPLVNYHTCQCGNVYRSYTVNATIWGRAVGSITGILRRFGKERLQKMERDAAVYEAYKRGDKQYLILEEFKISHAIFHKIIRRMEEQNVQQQCDQTQDAIRQQAATGNSDRPVDGCSGEFRRGADD